MKITKLILKNFAAIYNAMNSHEIEIDFTGCNNKVCLLIAPNGKGKTSILSQLQPFSDVGSLDVRNNLNLILDKKDGYKEIHYLHNGNKYVIKHFYTAHKDSGHSVKSYITKNDVELNPNGNVSSFKEIIREELQIEIDYLKLIRLGSNVTSLIDLSTTERKAFMGKILDEIGVFLELYKSTNLKVRQLDEMISHDMAKLNKLNIIDKKEFKKEIKQLEDDIAEKEKKFIELNGNLSILKATIDSIEDKENLKENLKNTRSKVRKMEDTLSNKGQTESIDFYSEKISSITSKIASNDNQIYTLSMLINSSLQHVNSLQDQLHNIQVQLSKENDFQNEIERMSDNLKELEMKYKESKFILNDFSSNVSVQEFTSLMNTMRDLQNLLSSTYEFGLEAVKKVCDLILNAKNVKTYINSHLLNLDDSKADDTSALLNKFANMIKDDSVISKCEQSCPAKEIFVQIKNLLDSRSSRPKNKTAEFYIAMDSVYTNLSLLRSKLVEHTDTITKLPKEFQELFTIKSIYTKIGNSEIIFDEKLFNDYLTLVTEYEHMISIGNDIEKYKEDIAKFKKLSNYKSVSSQYESISDMCNDELKSISKMKSEESLLEEENKELRRDLELNSDIKDALENLNDMKDLLSKYEYDAELLASTNDEIMEVGMKIKGLSYDIDNLKKSVQEKLIALSQYEDISKELEKMNKIYDELVLTKRACSSKEGVPLRYIKNYLQNTEEITNELLNIAYDGRIYLDEFHITPTEFQMPFYNNGFKMEDVKFASQGELSFLSIALSFALSSQVLSKYNIMLLDEIDGALDKSNREKFIKILENQIDRVGTEQSFLITHNSMFSSYPVDIINLDFNNPNIEDYSLAQMVKVTLR